MAQGDSLLALAQCATDREKQVLYDLALVWARCSDPCMIEASRELLAGLSRADKLSA